MEALAAALIKAGIPQKVGIELPATRLVQSKEKAQWYKIFNFPLTKFEIPILIKVQCKDQFEGLKFIAGYKLNSIEADSEVEAKEKINQKLNDIQFNMKGTDSGCPLYWKFHS